MTAGTDLRTTTPGYDELNRVTSATVTVSGIADATGTTSTTIGYDGLGRVVSTSAHSDTINVDYLDSQAKTVVRRGSTSITETVTNPDGSVASRRDNGGPTVSFTYDKLGRLTSAPLATGAVETYTWRLDDLAATRSYGGLTISYGYDSAKRPTSASVTRTVSGTPVTDTMTRTYDRVGNATSDCLRYGATSCSPLAGWYESYSYDTLNRVTLTTVSVDGSPQTADQRSYVYNADSERTKLTIAGVDTVYTYDATGSIQTKKVDGSAPDTFTYDPLGNLAVSYPGTPAAPTSYQYDPAGQLTKITAGSTVTSFSLDALGRHWVRTPDASNPAITETYSYLGTSGVVNRIDGAGGAASTLAYVDPLGARFAIADGSGAVSGYLLPDLHGNTAALYTSALSPVASLYYDPYGVTLSNSSAGSVPWRYQGRLTESAAGQSDLYDFGARNYDPGLGAFTQLDSVAGGVTNSMTLNRYLYAEANPATLVDPDGHCPKNIPECIGLDTPSGSSSVSSSSSSSGTSMWQSSPYYTGGIIDTVASSAHWETYGAQTAPAGPQVTSGPTTNTAPSSAADWDAYTKQTANFNSQVAALGVEDYWATQTLANANQAMTNDYNLLTMADDQARNAQIAAEAAKPKRDCSGVNALACTWDATGGAAITWVYENKTLLIAAGAVVLTCVIACPAVITAAGIAMSTFGATGSLALAGTDFALYGGFAAATPLVLSATGVTDALGLSDFEIDPWLQAGLPSDGGWHETPHNANLGETPATIRSSPMNPIPGVGNDIAPGQYLSPVTGRLEPIFIQHASGPKYNVRGPNGRYLDWNEYEREWGTNTSAGVTPTNP